MRVKAILECEECGQRNYMTEKNKKNTSGRMSLKKYCKREKKHTIHKETK